MEDKSAEFNQRLEKSQAIRDSGVDPYPNDFKPASTCRAVVDEFDGLSKEELEGTERVTSVAGRVMAKRDFGKASFISIQDRTGTLQSYVKKNIIGDEPFALFKKCDVGDILGVEGTLFRTKTDELTIEVKTLRLLCKGLSPLPEKWHGLKDVEARYRQRYLDLIVNPDVRKVFLQRTEIIRYLREYLGRRDYVEVETPMLQPIPGGAAAKPFKTYHNALGMELFMRIAPELYLKRLIVGGLERVFEINRNFRNEGISTQHNPEFTMLEFYEAFATFEDLMDLTEDMISGLAEKLHSTMKIEYQGTPIDFTPPWDRITVKEAILKHSEADESIFADAANAANFAKGLGLDLPDAMLHDKIILEIFEHVAEHKFIAPTFVTHYPTGVSPLSRKSGADATTVDRFELIVMGREIANAFSELNDPVDQRGRFKDQLTERESGDEEAQQMDEDFLTALEYGMPPTAGEGIGIDRLVMILTDSPSIRDVILFPQLRSS